MGVFLTNVPQGFITLGVWCHPRSGVPIVNMGFNNITYFTKDSFCYNILNEYDQSWTLEAGVDERAKSFKIRKLL